MDGLLRTPDFKHVLCRLYVFSLTSRHVPSHDSLLESFPTLATLGTSLQKFIVTRLSLSNPIFLPGDDKRNPSSVGKNKTNERSVGVGSRVRVQSGTGPLRYHSLRVRSPCPSVWTYPLKLCVRPLK